ncbi:MAG: electron transfer flavoprotein subunit alpha/FixB family protein [Chloroflexi bacterium]|nr:electron transfer flavoprotein subunit alpha/FixB family protein [Chloroflexota bacterium]
MSGNVFVWIEQSGGKANSASWEAVGLARRLAGELGGQVIALVFGQGVDSVAQAAFQYGADEVIKADDPSLAHYRFAPYVSLLAKLVQERNPAVVLAAASTSGREVLAGAAADVNAGLLTDVTELSLEGGKLRAVRPILGGKVLREEAIVGEGPQFATLRNRAFPAPQPDTSRSGTVTEAAPALSEDQIATKVERVEEAAGTISLTDATIIVAGGRGVGGPDGFGPVRDLADVLGGAVGASRAAVDAGWIPYEHQVGQTGKVVSPDLYIAAGISGAIQHQAGMRTARVIVAINKDADAPIFRLAQYGLVGDLFQILPALAEEFRKRLS